MRVALVLFLTSLALAGCSDDGADEPGSGLDGAAGAGTSGGVEEGQASTRSWLNDTFTLSFTESTLGERLTRGSNCIVVEGVGSFRILEGMLTATWDGGPPQSEELGVRASLTSGGHRDASAYVASPLEYRISSLPAAEGDAAYMFAFGIPPTSATVEQTVEVDASFRVEGTASVGASICSVPE